MNSHSCFSFMFSSSPEFSQISWNEWKLKLVDQTMLWMYIIFFNNWIHLKIFRCQNSHPKIFRFFIYGNVDSLHIIQRGSIFLIYPHIAQRCIFSVKSQLPSFTICPSALNTLSVLSLFLLLISFTSYFL